MNELLDFQSIMLKLQNYWAAHGCLIGQPYYTQVGAGTMNPATFLRVLGPEPWNVAYVEPSVRPDDGRYGENPNRFQMHYQFQVILKPDTGNPQELYLQSLQAIGIDPRQHDIRFVEDNWAQPAISAWGLGWEVWLDGQEITQFTYFQQVGGVALDPVAVEITYGLERILIALNNAAAIWDEPWAPGVTYGEVRRHDELEHSQYYFETADVARMRQMFDLYEAEAKACLDQGLMLPAHDYVLKCSHTFNILDTRGAIGVTERQGFFRRMRALARQVAEGYLAQRRSLEFPLLKDVRLVQTVTHAEMPAAALQASDFVLEIGVEELPAGDVDSAVAQLQEKIPAWLAELRLTHGEVQVFGTPRRLIARIAHLSARQDDLEQVVKGPPAERAFDAEGHPTRAAEGFARGKGVAVSDLEVCEIDGGQYVAAVVRQNGRPAPEVLCEALPGLVASIEFVKSMRWNASGVAFSRPIRWLVALLGEMVIPFEYAGLIAGRTTRGLRPYGSPAIEISSVAKYFVALEQAGVVWDSTQRSQMIREQVNQLAEQAHGRALVEPALLAEVTNLVEMPTAVSGNFQPEFLNLPKDVLISVMKKHQRYFPVLSADGDDLLPAFIAVRNGDAQHLDIVRQGNEHVIGARFADANFFVREDLKHPLESYRPKLSTLVFQTQLGSMLDKAERIEKLTAQLADQFALNAADRAMALRAAHLCKADLTTQMVVEMTSLQGVIGREYALRSGEPQAVAEAIGEQYQLIPQSLPGLTLALADRLDSLTGLFAAGLAPTGAKDPFGQRRAALGVVQPLISHELNIDLRAAICAAAALQPVPVSDEVQSQTLGFITGRLRAMLLDAGWRYDGIDAVLAAQQHDPAAAAQAVETLSHWVARPDWTGILAAYARCVRITRDQKERFAVKPAAFVEKAERDLFAEMQKAETSERFPGSVDGFFNAFLPLIPAINRFFEQVMVMDEDPRARQNRLGLLQRIAALAADVADFSVLEGF